MSKKQVIASKEYLIYFHRRVDITEWTDLWLKVPLDKLIQKTLKNPLLSEVFLKHLQKNMMIIDLGCGLAQWVKVLQDLGYDVSGVDYSVTALRKAKQYDDRLTLIASDVLNLPFRDQVFDAAITLGVIEHFKEGPNALLKEIRRILKEEGLLFISVPFFNPVRKMKFYLNFYGKIEGHVKVTSYSPLKNFYQYAFSKKLFSRYLAENGFRIVDIIPYAGVKGLLDEIPGGVSLKRSLLNFDAKKVNNEKVRTPRTRSAYKAVYMLMRKALDKFFGHMILFVAKKQCNIN